VINLSDKKVSEKVLSEKETRKKILIDAAKIGAEFEIQRVFNQVDSMLLKCTNEKEAEDIKKLGIITIYKILGGGGELYLKHKNKENFVLVCKED
jgi:hypothetical protein